MNLDDRAIALATTAQLLGRRALRDDRGEGVISTAIVVLIVALLGAALWAAFDGIFDDATDRAGTEIRSIGG